MKTLILKTVILSGLLFLIMKPNMYSQENLPLVTVTGKGEVKVTPDEVAIRFGVMNVANSPEEARQGVEAIFKEITTLTARNKIMPIQISMDYMQLEPWPPDYAAKVSRRQYSASQGMTIVINDISIYKDFISQLLKTGINRIDNVDFRTSQLRKYQDDARELAIKAAREKAEALAKALGQSIGQAYSIEENEPGYPILPGFHSNAMNENLQPNAPLGQISVTANITVKFYLK